MLVLTGSRPLTDGVGAFALWGSLRVWAFCVAASRGGTHGDTATPMASRQSCIATRTASWQTHTWQAQHAHAKVPPTHLIKQITKALVP